MTGFDGRGKRASRPRRGRGSRTARPVAEILEGRQLLATITVNSAGDAGGPDGSETLTLRQAIEVANGTLAISSLTPSQASLVDGPLAIPNTIRFHIPGPGPFTITPATVLPPITGPVIVDGYSQPGSRPNTNGPGLPDNAVLRIGIDGIKVPKVDTNDATASSGLVLSGGDSTVQGLSIVTFGSSFRTSPRLEITYVGGGIFLTNKGGNVVRGNFLGLKTSGNRGDSAGSYGVYDESFFGPGNTIGGTTPSDRNVISGNSIGINTSTKSVILGNFIGTDPTGTRKVPGSGEGIQSFAEDVTIGGTAAGAGNLISGNPGAGISLGGNGRRNLVQGNLIGTDAAGTRAVPNGVGIRFSGDHRLNAAATTIGGTAFGTRNVISGNRRDGIVLGTLNIVPPLVLIKHSNDNLILGNFIGTGPDGMTPLPNAGNGIYVLGGSNNTIGGQGLEAANVIAFNGKAGVLIGSTPEFPAIGGPNVGNRISGNAIYANGGLGIDLVGRRLPIPPIDFGGDGVTPNNPAGSPDGPNRLQPYPVLIQAPVRRAFTDISTTLDALPFTTYTVEFFADSEADPSGFGQGMFYLGSTEVTTDAAGHVAFEFSTLATLVGRPISATATDPEGNTSEFARDILGGFRTTTTLLESPNPVAQVGQPITFIASVIAVGSFFPMGGMVDFLDGDTVIGSAPLGLFNAAVFVTPGLSPGPHAISAIYRGVSFFAPSRSEALAVNVSSASILTITSLSGPGQVVRLGRPATLTAFVGTASGVPTGRVFFLDGDAILGSATVDASGVAIFVTSTLAPGPHALSASYEGDLAHAPSRSASQPANVFAPRAFAGPAVESAVFVGRRSVRITFNRGLAPDPAQNLVNYAILGPGRRSIAVVSAVYDPATDSVTLTTRRKLDHHQPFQLTIKGRRVGGVADVFGLPLDGRNNGRPGHDFVGPITIRKAPTVRVEPLPVPGPPEPPAPVGRRRAQRHA